MEKSIPDQSSKSKPLKCPVTDNSTTLQASEAGPLLFDLPDGETGQSLPGVALASPTPAPASEKDSETPATFGPSSFALSEDANPRLFSESKSVHQKLSDRLAMMMEKRLKRFGSIEYAETWARRVTPSGPALWAHTASARRTSGKDCTGWPTANTPSGGRSVEGADATGKMADGTKHTASLEHAVKFAGFNTPRATDGSNWGPNQANGALSADAALAGWKTAMAQDGERRVSVEPGDKTLNNQAALAGWATTNWHDGRRPGADVHSTQGGNLSRDALLGLTTELFRVPTGRRAVLAPEFSLWLMGFPEAWVAAAPGAKDWREAQAALALECSKEAETP